MKFTYSSILSENFDSNRVADLFCFSSFVSFLVTEFRIVSCDVRNRRMTEEKKRKEKKEEA